MFISTSRHGVKATTFKAKAKAKDLTSKAKDLTSKAKVKSDDAVYLHAPFPLRVCTLLTTVDRFESLEGGTQSSRDHRYPQKRWRHQESWSWMSAVCCTRRPRRRWPATRTRCWHSGSHQRHHPWPPTTAAGTRSTLWRSQEKSLRQLATHDEIFQRRGLEIFKNFFMEILKYFKTPSLKYFTKFLIFIMKWLKTLKND